MNSIEQEPFFLYSYKNKDLLGIGANLDIIKKGDETKLEKFLYIKKDDYINLKEFKNCFGMIFSNIDKNIINGYCTIMNEEYKRNNNLSVIEIIFKLENIFKKDNSELIIKKYLGYYSELFFIYYLKQNNINVSDYYSFSNNDTLDFHFNNDVNVEIKTINLSNNSFLTNYRQLDIINKNDLSRYIGVELIKDSINGKNIEELFNLIKKDNHNFKKLNKWIEEIRSNDDIFKEFKFDLNNSKLKIIDKQHLPIIKIKDTKTIISANFNLFAYSSNEDVVEYIKKVI